MAFSYCVELDFNKDGNNKERRIMKRKDGITITMSLFHEKFS